MSTPLARLQSQLGYRFKDETLLQRAVTHPSYLPEHPDVGESNQRLEFLGDAVLQLVLTEELFQLFPGEREGALSKRRASLANGTFLVELARELGLETSLLLGSSEESTGGRIRASSLEDAFEAVVGALYLDSDLATARRIVLGLYGPLPDRLAVVQDADNPKGRLQEIVQPSYGNHALHYEVTATEGEDHAKSYLVAVFLNDRQLGTGRGSSKKLAEEAAARTALVTLAGDKQA
ncbi:MAG TPA: ribonuclease III [Opitutaceae bacterium]|nr:ribonuclease III [Opitutaceae bacterium]